MKVMTADVSLCYAGALFSVASELNRTDEFLSELSALEELFSEYPDYIKLLDDPELDYTERLRLIDEAFGGFVSREIVSFMKILSRRRSMNIFTQCIGEFNKLYDEHFGMVKAEVVSAFELTDDERQSLKKALEKKFAKKTELTFRVDKSLIGGFTVTADGKIIDYSIKNRLKQIREMSEV